MLTAKVQLAAHIEAEEGTAESLAGADALLVSNFSFRPNIAMKPRNQSSASLSQFSQVPGVRSGVIEFDVEIKGSGTAGTPPALGKLLKACAFAETIVESTSVTYTPASASVPSITLGGYHDGIIEKIWGARGTAKISLKDGEPGSIHFTFTGADFSVTDGAMLSSGVSYETTVPPALLSAALAVDSYAAIIGTLDVDVANAVALRQDANSPSGHKSAVITGRTPTMNIDPETVTVATYDFYGKWRSGNLGALTTALTGAAGNICTITAPKVQYTAITPGDKSGVQNLSIGCALTRDSGDDEISIAFT